MTAAAPSLRTLQREAALEIARLNAAVWHDLYTLHVALPCCDGGNLCPLGQALNDAAYAAADAADAARQRERLWQAHRLCEMLGLVFDGPAVQP